MNNALTAKSARELVASSRRERVRSIVEKMEDSIVLACKGHKGSNCYSTTVVLDGIKEEIADAISIIRDRNFKVAILDNLVEISWAEQW